MQHGLGRLILVAALFACAGCGGDGASSNAAGPKAATVPPAHKPLAAAATPRPKASKPTSDIVQRYPNPGADGWVTYSGDGTIPAPGMTWFRFPGDSASRYYKIDVFMDDDSQYAEINNDKGKVIANFTNFIDDVGIRKTPGSIDIFGYHGVESGLPEYEIIRIANGREYASYYCSMDRAVFERIIGKSFIAEKDGSASYTESGSVVFFLASEEPKPERDHCTKGSQG
ncbi:MAG: hypothetical protein P0Y59_14850 [Candidatus Sphingomonas phytovorans]|nr:hypothetical protein [Sphingomonas sp.]WEJ98220.1 MAG: hypothetical protein P0Y59_14850 [Sphingomonas sp.]